MLSLKNPCIVLEGAVGTSEYLGLGPQSDLIFWREVWLEVKEIPSVQEVAALAKLE